MDGSRRWTCFAGSWTRSAPGAAASCSLPSDRAVTEYWNCVIEGHAQQGIDVFELDAQGRVVNQTVWLRPWPTVTVLRDRDIAGQLPSLPADFWLLPAAPKPTGPSFRQKIKFHFPERPMSPLPVPPSGLVICFPGR
jgi:hypothetical protein